MAAANFSPQFAIHAGADCLQIWFCHCLPSENRYRGTWALIPLAWFETVAQLFEPSSSGKCFNFNFSPSSHRRQLSTTEHYFFFSCSSSVVRNVQCMLLFSSLRMGPHGRKPSIAEPAPFCLSFTSQKLFESSLFHPHCPWSILSPTRASTTSDQGQLIFCFCTTYLGDCNSPVRRSRSTKAVPLSPTSS